MMSFRDTYSCDNQILIHPDDQRKTTFIKERGIYCFKVMPFGLKNAGAMYQRLVNKMFADFIGNTMGVYIDDMIVELPREQDHLDHLRQAFGMLRKYGMKLNPTKCSFGVTSGKFLGYFVIKLGIEADPRQIKAVENIQSPKSVKDVQNLTNRLVALNRFISKYSDKSRPFFNTLRKEKTSSGTRPAKLRCWS